MINKLLSVVLVATILFLSSCAAMTRTSTYNANIKTNNPNAKIYANGEMIGTGQAKGTFKRNNDLQITVKEEGCEDYTKNITKKFGVGFVFINWGLAGLIVDIATGAAYKPNYNIHPEVKKVDLKNFDITIDNKNCN